jgi:hypothetical protein
MSHNDFEHSASYVRTVRLLNLLRMKKMTYDFLQMGINPETAGILIVHIVQVLYQTVSVSQDKIREIKEIFDMMGLPYILSHIDVENILRLKPGAAAERVQAGGSPRMTPKEFMTSMGIKPNSKKSSPFSSFAANRKSSTKTTQKRGGSKGDKGDCYGKCKKDADCRNGSCRSCVNQKCVPDTLEVVPHNTDTSDVVGLVVSQSTNSQVMQLAIRSKLAQQAVAILEQQQKANIEERGSLLSSFDNRQDAALSSVEAQRKEASAYITQLEKELAEMVDAASKKHDAEFEKLLGTLEDDLKGRKRNERVAGLVGAVAGALGVNFFTTQLDNIVGGLYTFITWILLAGQSVLDHIPFLNRVIPRFLDATCFTSPLPNMLNGAIFPTLTRTNTTATTYDYTWQNIGGQPYKVFGDSTCPEGGWLAFGERIGECVAKTGFETITTCTAAGIQFFKTNTDLFGLIMLLGSVIGGLFFYLTYRIVTLQTPVTEYEMLTTQKKRRGTDWLAPVKMPLNILKDSATALATGSVVGAYLMAPFSSSERAELQRNVDNREIPFDNFDHPINQGEFRGKRDDLFKNEIRYTSQVRAINDARTRRENLEQMGLTLLQETTQNQQAVAKLLIEHQVQTSRDLMSQVVPAIMNDPAAMPQMLLENSGSSSNTQLPSSSRQLRITSDHVKVQNNSPPLPPSLSSQSSHSAPSSPSSQSSHSSPSSQSSPLSLSRTSSSQSSPPPVLPDLLPQFVNSKPPPPPSRKGSRKEGGRRKRGTRRSIRRRTSRRRK